MKIRAMVSMIPSDQLVDVRTYLENERLACASAQTHYEFLENFVAGSAYNRLWDVLKVSVVDGTLTVYIAPPFIPVNK